jgi:LEA14-like dessication related protein
MTENSKKAIIYSIVGSITLIVGYAIISIRKQIRLAKQMRFSFGGAKVLPNVGKDLGVKIILSVENKSDLGITADLLNLDIYVNGIYVNKILQKTSQKIKPKGKSNVEFNVYFNPLEVLQGLKIENILMALDYKKINLKIIGYVSGSVDGITFSNYPFELEEKLGNLIGK